MTASIGLRERKRAAMRQRIADVAAHLFAERGFDEVSILDVARAADVSEQTVYNYFPAKHDLALDLAEAIRQRYYELVVNRGAEASPAAALRVMADEDIERYRTSDITEARGEFYALCVSSAVVRRFGLAVRDQQIETIRDAIKETDSQLHPALVHTHAAALVSVFQLMADHIGRSVVAQKSADHEAAAIQKEVDVAFDDLDRQFRSLIKPSSNQHSKKD